jgi:peroxiredoxin
MNHPLRLTVALVALAFTLGGGIPRGPMQAHAGKAEPEAQVGKPAPAIQPDFAVKGEPISLAKRKGKVVLLYFWAPWSGPCRTAIAQLKKWHEDYESKGLEIVAVSPYNSEHGKHLAFDKEAGKPYTIERATNEDDRKLLRDFADYYRIQFPLVVLPRDEAKQVYTAYGVKRIPQFVLIDRKGRVRMIRVGANPEQYEALDEEIKKLVEERR